MGRLAVCGLLWGVAACQSTTTGPAPADDAPGLDVGDFVTHVEPILEARCASVACHGGQGSGELLLTGGLDPLADYRAARGHVVVGQPDASALVLKPLAEALGGVVHGGGDLFADSTDADLRTIQAWIRSEALE